MSFGIWYQFKHQGAYVASVALLTLCAALAMRLLYQVFLSPLRSIPGPFAARITRFWELSALNKGGWVHTQLDLHKQYGTCFQDGIARITTHGGQVPLCALHLTAIPSQILKASNSYTATLRHSQSLLFIMLLGIQMLRRPTFSQSETRNAMLKSGAWSLLPTQ
jgi:hypothetical protein